MEEQEIGGKKLTISASIDAVGLYCPMPIILLKKEIGIVKSNQVVEILADDSSFENDLSAWCKLTDNKVLSITKNNEDIFIAYVKKF
jgi:tRNA 2-thiouridine synthesizing protein A